MMIESQKLQSYEPSFVYEIAGSNQKISNDSSTLIMNSTSQRQQHPLQHQQQQSQPNYKYWNPATNNVETSNNSHVQVKSTELIGEQSNPIPSGS